MPERPEGDVVRWHVVSRAAHGRPLIFLIVDDSADDELVSLIASEDEAPNSRFGGAWTGTPTGKPVAAFHLIELGGGRGGFGRQWVLQDPDRALLEAALVPPHNVAVLPAEIAGDAATDRDFIPRLASALIVEVLQRSPAIELLLPRL